jgi:hypothetical protein
MDNDADDVYFKAFICLRGDVDNAALTEEGCFAVEDSRGRNWVCREIAKEALLSESKATSEAVCEMQERLMAAGFFNTGGTRMRVFATRLLEPITWDEQIEQLRESLGESEDDEDEGEEWKQGKEPE